jgi:membrane protease YdiL (CAAX protease family)
MNTRAVRAEFPTVWRAGCAYSLLAIVFVLTVAMPIAAYWGGQPLRADTMDLVGLFAGQGVLGAFLLLWFVLRRRTSVRSFLTLRTGGWTRRIAEGLRVGVIGWLSTMAVLIVLGTLVHPATIAPQPGFAQLMVWMARRPLALRLALIAAAMVVEEAFFRAFLQPRVGIVVATLWFAMSHMNYGSPTMGAGVLVIGAVLGRAYQRTGDLAVCAIAHGTFDAIQLLVVLPLLASYGPV